MKYLSLDLVHIWKQIYVFPSNSSVFYLRVKTHAPKNWIIIFQKNIYILEVRGANPALLLAPAEGLGPSNPVGGRSGPAMGLWPPALELKNIYTPILL